MKLKNILIVVKDIEVSKCFYKDLFGLDVVLDNDGNVILTEGLVLQDKQIWESFIQKDVTWKGHDTELYFKEKGKIKYVRSKVKYRKEENDTGKC